LGGFASQGVAELGCQRGIVEREPEALARDTLGTLESMSGEVRRCEITMRPRIIRRRREPVPVLIDRLVGLVRSAAAEIS
jgi:hypothetical protein